MRRTNYSDEITALQNRSAQLVSTLEQIASEDWPRIESGFAEFKILSRDVKPVAEKRDGLNITDPNIPDPGTPREDLVLLRRKLEAVAVSLDRSAELLSERRDAIAALLAV
jgi:hypothetical protein